MIYLKNTLRVSLIKCFQVRTLCLGFKKFKMVVIFDKFDLLLPIAEACEELKINLEIKNIYHVHSDVKFKATTGYIGK